MDFFAVPMWVLWTCLLLDVVVRKGKRMDRTLVANFKLVTVSLRCASIGLAMTNMRVLEFPPSEY